jgi:hypothetical protein
MKASVAAALAIAACTLLAVSQVPAPAGSITGTVRDSVGTVIPGVTVTAAGPGGKASTVTNESGGFTLSGLPAGLYSVSAALPGFLTDTLQNVTVGDTRIVLSFTLRVGPQQPFRAIPPLPLPRRNLNVVADAQISKGSLTLYRGNVRMTVDGVELTCDELDLNTVTLEAAARGNVTVRLLPPTARVIPLE